MSNGLMGYLVVIPDNGWQEIFPLSREHIAISDELVASVKMGLRIVKKGSRNIPYRDVPYADIRHNEKGDPRYMFRVDFSGSSHDPSENLGTSLRFKFCKTEAEAKAFRCKGIAPLKR